MGAANLEQAISIAVEAHRGSVDKSGVPYILHPLRLMSRMTTDAERMIAVLHDVVEDTNWTLDALRAEGFSEDILSALDCLTRREGETYEAFIARASANPLARRVKIADLEDNMDIRRLSRLADKDVGRLRRYLQAWQFIAGVDCGDGASV